LAWLGLAWLGLASGWWCWRLLSIVVGVLVIVMVVVEAVFWSWGFVFHAQRFVTVFAFRLGNCLIVLTICLRVILSRSENSEIVQDQHQAISNSRSPPVVRPRLVSPFCDACCFRACPCSAWCSLLVAAVSSLLGYSSVPCCAAPCVLCCSVLFCAVRCGAVFVLQRRSSRGRWGPQELPRGGAGAGGRKAVNKATIADGAGGGKEGGGWFDGIAVWIRLGSCSTRLRRWLAKNSRVCWVFLAVGDVCARQGLWFKALIVLIFLSQLRVLGGVGDLGGICKQGDDLFFMFKAASLLCGRNRGTQQRR